VGDDRVYTVNEVVSALGELHGRTVLIACVLRMEFEGYAIWHRPGGERLPDYGSSLWANFDREALARDGIEPERFQARHVVVRATVDRDQTGHMGLWPGAVLIHSIAKAGGGPPA